MKKYRVTGTVTASKYLGEFEANLKEEAEEMALNENGSVSICHQCDKECSDPEIQEAWAEEIAEAPTK